METIRTFIAIDLPADVTEALVQAQTTLRAVDVSIDRAVRWLSPDSIHLTLKFLGDTPVSKLDAIGQAIEAAATGRVFQLTLHRAGCFPTLARPRVVWVGVTGEVGALAALQNSVEEKVSPLGFQNDSRSFSAHLTLGRVRDEATPDVRQRLGLAIQSLLVQRVSFPVGAISLIRSELRAEGPVYTHLAEVAFGAHVSVAAPTTEQPDLPRF